MHLFLDESGDLGFDFNNKNPSHFFVVTLVQVASSKSIKFINNGINKTLANKINHTKKKRIVTELKGSDTRLEVKKYLLSYINRHINELTIYSIILNKKRLLLKKTQPLKEIVYNQMAHQLLEKIKFSNTQNINLTIDKSKNSFGIKKFNDYLYANLTLCLDLETKLYISHENSIRNKGIQLADIFCHGIARKYELKDLSWYNEFKEKIAVECEFKY